MAKGLTTDKILNPASEHIPCHEDNDMGIHFVLGRFSNREMFSNCGQGLFIQKHLTSICF